MKRRQYKNKTLVNIIMASIIAIIVFLTVGYAAFIADFSISNVVTKIRPNKVVRVTNASTNSLTVSDVDYSIDYVVGTVSIPAGDSITYNVTVTNLGNVPVAVSSVEFDDGRNTINSLSTTINNQNYEKICNGNQCTNDVSKEITLTITNNGSTAVNGYLNTHLTFQEVYDVTYEGSKIGEVLSGGTFTYNYPSQTAPSVVFITEGNYDSTNPIYNATNKTLTIPNVTSNITAVKGYNIIYNAEVLGQVVHGGTYTYHFTSMWPIAVNITSGNYGAKTYANDILTITNVTSDIECVAQYGEIAVTSIAYNANDSVNVLTQTTPTPDGMSANFNITYKRADDATTNDMKAVYDITLTNDYYNDYIFNGFDFNPTITANAGGNAYIEPELIGVTQGQTIPARTTKSFQLVLHLIADNPNDTYGASGNAEGETTEPTQETGTLTATLTPNSGDLRSPNTRVALSVTVVNTYTSAKTYRLLSSSSNFELVDANNNPIDSFTIDGEDTDPLTIYVIANSNALFNSSTANTSIFLSSEGMANTLVETVTFDVDVSSTVDTTPPTVSIDSFGMVYAGNNSYPTVGSLKVTWTGQDNQGGSGVANYTVKIYNSSGTFSDSQTVGSTFNNATFTNLADDTYYVVVYGEDNYHNSGAAYESQADTSPYAAKSSSNSYKWRFKVDVSKLENMSCDKTEAYLMQTYTCKLTADNSYSLPNSMSSVKMNGTALSTTQSSTGSYYSYSRNNGTLNVYRVNGDLALEGSATYNGCLIEGTKILMANGEYKNIENIDYDDLVMVHSYDTGELVPGYLVWIEKAATVKDYQKNTFSDGTVLNSYSWHGLFSPELKRFVSTDNPEEFHVGTKVLKLNKERSGYDVVTVTSIETIHETVNYYHIVSNGYYNTFSNDLLTTVGTVIMSNLYGFEEDVTWPKEIRAKAMEDMYTYDDLKDVLPHYMYIGLRAEEAKFLTTYGLDIDSFKYYLANHLSNPKMVKPPIQKLGKNMWMVTTSEDNVTSLNKSNYLRPEGSTYTLPKSKRNRKVSWYNTSNGKTYHEGDKVPVELSMYFQAIYE